MIESKITKKSQTPQKKFQGKPYLKNQKKASIQKKRAKNIFWEQGLEAKRERQKRYQNLRDKKKRSKKKKSLQYIFYLKKYRSIVEYTNLKLLKVFLTKYGKIKARRKTRVVVQQHKKIAKSIRKARILKLLPFNCTYEVDQKRKVEKS